ELADDNLHNYLKIDTILSDKLINIQTAENIQKLRPFGQDNQNPLFLMEKCEVLEVYGVGENKKHLKLKLRKNSLVFDAIAFNMGNYLYHINHHDYLNIVGTLEINEFNQNITVQINIKDLS